MRAISLLFLDPRFHPGSQSTRCAAEGAQQAIVGAYRPDAPIIGAFFRADTHQFQESLEVARRYPIAIHARRFTHVCAKLDSLARSEDRPAVVNEEFREHPGKSDINNRQNHTRVAIPRSSATALTHPIIAPRGYFVNTSLRSYPRQPWRTLCRRRVRVPTAIEPRGHARRDSI